MQLPRTQCVEALNVDFYDGTLGRKRPGAASVSTTGGTAFASGILDLFAHIPGSDPALAELWGADGAGLVKRLTGGTSFANVTLDDAIASNFPSVSFASLNGKLFMAYDSTVDRLHVYDPNLSAPRVRRVNFATPAAPTVANQGVGAYAATARYYRVRWLQKAGTVLIRRSEAGPSQAFTPSGGGLSARVTQPTPPGEGETHWEVETSPDNSAFYQHYAFRDNGSGDLSIAIATTFQDDTSTVSDVPATGSAQASGFYGRFPSVKYLITDGNRLLGAGAWEASGADSGGKNSRVWFTPVLGSADKGDDERVPNQTTQKNWVDLNENDGGGVTALMGPLNGVPYVAKYRALHKLVPTGDAFAPYQPRKISDWIGCVGGKAWCVGRDDAGQPCIYFYSPDGPYRIGASGVQYLGRDNEGLWASVNLGATGVVSWVLYVPELHQIWYHVATGASNDPDVRMVFDVLLGRVDEHNQVRGGWVKHTGDAPSSRCGCLFANTLGASMSRDLKPYLGRSSGTTILKGNTTDKNDNGNAVQGYVTTRPILPDDSLGHNYRVEEAYLLGEVNASDTITVTVSRDFGRETKTGTTGLVAEASETRIQKRVEDTDFSGAGVVQYTVGDGSALSSNWILDALIAPTTRQEAR